MTTVSAGRNHAAAIDENGVLWTWGYNEHGQLGDGTKTDSYTPVKVMENVVSVSCGQYFTAAITSDGALWMWGDNNLGELGTGLEGNDRVSG